MARYEGTQMNPTTAHPITDGMYHFIWGGDEAGLYYNHEMVASEWALNKCGYDIFHMLHWTQKALARVAENVNRWLKS